MKGNIVLDLFNIQSQLCLPDGMPQNVMEVAYIPNSD